MALRAWVYRSGSDSVVLSRFSARSGQGPPGGTNSDVVYPRRRSGWRGTRRRRPAPDAASRSALRVRGLPLLRPLERPYAATADITICLWLEEVVCCGGQELGLAQ